MLSLASLYRAAADGALGRVAGQENSAACCLFLAIVNLDREFTGCSLGQWKAGRFPKARAG
jgi:hypothetical protein